MIRPQIQIEGGKILDLYDEFGFIYQKGDRRFSAPEKERDKTEYAEEEGQHEDRRAVKRAFDYKFNVVIKTPNKDLYSANAKIAYYNECIREKAEGTNYERCKQITFYDDYKRCKITGIAEIIESVEESDYYRREGADDEVIAEITIHVTQPSLCEFNTQIDAIK